MHVCHGNAAYGLMSVLKLAVMCWDISAYFKLSQRFYSIDSVCCHPSEIMALKMI